MLPLLANKHICSQGIGRWKASHPFNFKIHPPTYRWQRGVKIRSNQHHRERKHACAAIVYVSSSLQPSCVKPTCPSVGGLTRLVKRPKQVNHVVSFEVTGFSVYYSLAYNLFNTLCILNLRHIKLTPTSVDLHSFEL